MWEDNIRMVLKEKKWEGVDWMKLGQHRGGLLWPWLWTFGIHTRRGILWPSWVAI